VKRSAVRKSTTNSKEAVVRQLRGQSGTQGQAEADLEVAASLVEMKSPPVLSRQHRSSGRIRVPITGMVENDAPSAGAMAAMPCLEPIEAIVGNPLLSEAVPTIAPAISPMNTVTEFPGTMMEFPGESSDESGSRSLDDFGFFDDANVLDGEMVETLSSKSDTMLEIKAAAKLNRGKQKLSRNGKILVFF